MSKVNIDNRKECRKYYHSIGLCADCHGHLEADRHDKLYCRMCQTTYSEYKALWRDAHPEARAGESAYAKERRDRLAAEHKCIRCMSELPEGRKSRLCETCLEKQRKYQRKYLERKKLNEILPVH